ncbi:MAG: M20/M25/M40 family metallo-hydrolase [Bacteroidales bacterium]|nr:M20/M25/M40 family metallo-hydrolase [Bacteroidales bacterium]
MPLRKLICSLLPVFVLCQYIPAQDLEYAYDVINELTAPDMHGRGYVSDGDLIAAKYISKEYKKLGLKRISKNYFQPFNITVNTFPGEMVLSLNNLLLIPGKDYLVYPGSPSLQGEFETFFVPLQDILDDNKWLKIIAQSTGRFVLIEDLPSNPEALTQKEKEKINNKIDFFKYHPDCPAAGTIMFTKNKLAWRGATKEYYKPFFTVNTDVDPSLLTKVKVSVESEYFESYETQNVIGIIEGKKFKDSLIYLTAHYDHLGRMGENVYFPGANDNASGVAMVLNLAAHFTIEENRPDYTLVFLALGAEEMGIIGARHYADNPLLPLNQISFLINLDLAGNGQEGITVVNGTEFPGAFERVKKINDDKQLFPEVIKRGPACISDHCPFYEKGVPSFFIYTLGGSAAYHDIYDTPDNLPLIMFENYFKLLSTFIDSLQAPGN